MSKANYKIDKKVVAKVVKDAEKIKKMQEQIAELKKKMDDIREDNSWLRYTGEGAVQPEVTYEDMEALNEAHEIIKYAGR